MKFLGYKLRNLRDAKEISLLDLEKMTGIGNGHLSAIERGEKNPRPNTVEKICKALNIDQVYFYLEESRLPTDMLPEMPEDVKKFIMNAENTPYLVLTEQAAREGVPPEVIGQIINLFIANTRRKRI